MNEPMAGQTVERRLGRRDVEITSSSQQAVRALDDAILGLASHRAATAAHLRAALEADPGLVVAHCMAGFGARLLGRRDAWPDAHRSAAKARASLEARGGTEREELLTRSLEAWCAGAPLAAVDHLESALARTPLDLLTVKLSHALQFMLGRPSGMRRSLERVLPAWEARDTPGRGLVLGCYAFVLNETGEVGRAERVGRAALEEDPIDPWGVHAVTHALYTVGRLREGLAWLAAHERSLEGANNFAGHVHWHRALLLIALDELDEVLRIHDEHVAIHGTRDYRDVVNAATLLYRLERLGAHVGNRWDVLVEAASARLGDHALGFADVHYVLALVRGGKLADASRFVASMQAAASARVGIEAETTRDVAVPVAEAFVATSDRPDQTVSTLASIAPSLLRLGGSRAQREIFDLVLADAYVRERELESPRPRRSRTSRESASRSRASRSSAVAVDSISARPRV